MAKKQNYLNNRDLMIEIHKSKKTFCSYRNEELDSDYDLILPSMEEFYKDRERHIEEAKKNRADRLARVEYNKALARGEKVKLSQFTIDPNTFTEQDLVFRITNWDHIPLAPPKVKKQPKRKKKVVDTELVSFPEDEKEIPTRKKHIRLNFPPFYHWRLDENGDLFLVGKSHWNGTYNEETKDFDGVFDMTRGQITDKLAHMYMKLCERYGTKGNWRNYSYNDEMRGCALIQLIHVGLQFDEAKGSNPFSYYTSTITNSFTKVFNIEKRIQDMRDDILEANNFTPSYTRQVDNDMAIIASMEEKRRQWKESDSE